jgi:pimeloyl-ACP methyl ester carboxylesterase
VSWEAEAMLMRPRRVLLSLTVVLLTCALGAPAAPGATHSAEPRHHSVIHHKKRHHPNRHRHKKHHNRPGAKATGVRAIPVSFSVANANTSAVPCTPDDRAETIAGTLFLPATSTPNAVTVYVHGLGFSSYFWHFTPVPGYDYATSQAASGHASVVIDRLGYGASSIPPGMATCVGAQASIVHQVIAALRAGSYTATGQAPVSFSRLGLVGHSAGGEIAQIEAYSFHDIDALGVVDWADQSYSTAALMAFVKAGGECLSGGKAQGSGQPTGYASFGQSAAEYDSLMFHNTDPAVLRAATDARTVDPCGDDLSILNGVATDLLMVGSIKVPIVYVWGTDDNNYVIGSPWWQLQEAMYSASPKVTDVTLENSGHAVTLERTVPQLMDAMNAWLTENRL